MATKRSKKTKKIASSKKLPLNVKLSGNLNIPGLSNKAKKGSKINMPYFKGGKAGGGKGKGRNGGKSSQTVKVIIQTGQDGKSFAHANVPMPFAIPDPTQRNVIIPPTIQPTVRNAGNGGPAPRPFAPYAPIRIPPIKRGSSPSSSSSSPSYSHPTSAASVRTRQGFPHPLNWTGSTKSMSSNRSIIDTRTAISSGRKHYYDDDDDSQHKMITPISSGTGHSRFSYPNNYDNPNNHVSAVHTPVARQRRRVLTPLSDHSFDAGTTRGGTVYR